MWLSMLFFAGIILFYSKLTILGIQIYLIIWVMFVISGLLLVVIWPLLLDGHWATNNRKFSNFTTFWKDYEILFRRTFEVHSHLRTDIGKTKNSKLASKLAIRKWFHNCYLFLKGFLIKLLNWIQELLTTCSGLLIKYPTNYMFKVNNRNTRARCETGSKLTIQTPERRQWRC